MLPKDISEEDWLLARMTAPLMMAKIDEVVLLNNFVSWCLSSDRVLESEEYVVINGVSYLPVLTILSFGANIDCCLYVKNNFLEVDVNHWMFG